MTLHGFQHPGWHAFLPDARCMRTACVCVSVCVSVCVEDKERDKEGEKHTEESRLSRTSFYT